MVVLRGAAFALLIATPAALINTWLAEQDPKPAGALNLTLLAMVVGFAIGGYESGSQADADRARHGATAGLVAFVPVQLVGIVSRIGRGDPVSIGSMIFLAMLAAVAGTIGALIANRRSHRSDP